MRLGLMWKLEWNLAHLMFSQATTKYGTAV